jgi:pimeloyl-ACP methyl ester carboxylesterase
MGSSTDETLTLPRLLCLHGGGVNGDVFRMQARSVISAFKNDFRLVFADGPFFCDAGPGIVPVYADCGPFRRWLRWLPEHPPVDSEAAIDEIWWQLREAMDADDRAGATGEWVGLFGFSQGAKLSASLLFEQQVREERGIKSDDKRPIWKFAVLLAGRAPLVSLLPETDNNAALVTAGGMSEGVEVLQTTDDSHILKLPTIHVHGSQDAGLHLHQRLLNQYCDPNSVTLVEWDGGHRVPIKSSDVQKVTSATLEVARRAGVLV